MVNVVGSSGLGSPERSYTSANSGDTAVNEIWFGSEQSYDYSVEALKKYEAYVAANPQASALLMGSDSDEEDEKSKYLSVVDGVGIVTIEGPLVDRTLGWIGTLFGITGYGDVQKALVQAIQDPDVSSIFLVVKSGGGHVAGCHETAQLIANVDKVKPVLAYSPSTMCSAALWLGVSARKVYVGETAIVGSIGTLMVLASRSEQLKADGIDVKVIRAGKYKALGHPAEPLTDEAIAKATEQAEYLADIFLTHVAAHRGVGKATAKGQFGEGREFVGAQAVAVALVDGVQSYTTSFMAAKALAPSDNRTKLFAASGADTEVTADNSPQSKGTPMPNPHIPSPEQLAAMAAGVTLEADTTTSQAVQTETSAALEEVSAKLAEANSKLEAANTEIATLQESAKAQTEAYEAKISALAPLADIARASIRTMSVAMNVSVDSLAEVAPEALASLHAETSEKFKAKFKSGGVAATQTETEEEKKPAVKAVNPIFQAAALLRKQPK